MLRALSAGPVRGKARRQVSKLNVPQSSINNVEVSHSPNKSCCEQHTSISNSKPSFSEPCVQARDSHHQSLWLIEGRNLVSRASIRTSYQVRMSTPRRPTIGEPSDFRRVMPAPEITREFQPLELSIHLPGNELSSLPGFKNDWDEDLVITQPSQALVRPRLDSTLLRPSTSFSITRKPVPKRRTLSIDTTRYSANSHLCHEFTSGGPASRTLQRPIYTTTQSTQDFLNSLEARLPKPPEPSRLRAGSEPVFPLRRRASDQNLRLRNHIEEREQVERQLADCNTIIEETHGYAERGLHSNLERSTSDTAPSQTTISRPRATLFRRSTAPHILTTSIQPPALLTRDARCSDQLNLPIEHPTNDVNNANIESIFNLPSTRSRVSQWLLRSFAIPISGSAARNTPQNTPFYQCQSFFDDRASSTSSLETVSDAAELGSPWTTPKSSPYGKEKPASPYQTSIPAGGECFEGKKSGMVGYVGVAY